MKWQSTFTQYEVCDEIPCGQCKVASGCYIEDDRVNGKTTLSP